MVEDEFASLYERTGDIKHINVVLVPRLRLRELLEAERVLALQGRTYERGRGWYLPGDYLKDNNYV